MRGRPRGKMRKPALEVSAMQPSVISEPLTTCRLAARSKAAFYALVWLLTAALGSAVLAGSARPAAANTPVAADLMAMRALDERVAAVMLRLTTAIPEKCPHAMPGTGFVIHSLEQYAANLHPEVRQTFGFDTALAIAVVVPGSPAAQAGLRAGDSIVAINGIPIRAAQPDEEGTSLRRDAIERNLAELEPEAPISLQIRRGGDQRAYRIKPKAACRTRHEVRFGARDLALSDGDTIQFSDTFVSSANDDALAVIAAHELAHTALQHNRKLEAACVNGGLLAGLGDSRRKIRAAEDEADRLSIAILSAAGYDPAIAPAFWRGAGRKLGGGIFRARTHAAPAERARLLDLEITRWRSADQNQAN